VCERKREKCVCGVYVRTSEVGRDPKHSMCVCKKRRHRPLTSRRIRLASMRSSKARGIFLIATFSFRTSSFAELEGREREAGGAGEGEEEGVRGGMQRWRIRGRCSDTGGEMGKRGGRDGERRGRAVGWGRGEYVSFAG
jgi:hypothetical protein